VTTTLEPVRRVRPRRVEVAPGSRVVRWITSTDHKVIGYMYLTTSFAFFLIAGIMAEIMRTELARPGLQFVSTETYDQLFTIHGTLMLLFFATPLFVGFANVIMPLQIGAPDVAFPRLNMFSYWLFLFGGLILMSGFLTPGGAADFGWFAYSPLSNAVHSPGPGADLWIMGLALSGFGTILGGQYRERHQHEDRREQDVPGEDRHPEHRHAGGAQADDRGDEVDAAEDGAEPGQGEAHDPQVGSRTR
jgi:cytochrome c oxidase subunit 1